MITLNRTFKYLSAACLAGYKYGSVFTVKAPENTPDIGGRDLDEDKVEEWFEICEIAVRTLREADKTGALGQAGIQVDKAAMGLAQKFCAVGYVRCREREQTDESSEKVWNNSLQAGSQF